MAPGSDPGGAQPSKASTKEQAEDPAGAGEEASRRGGAAKEAKEASALEENTSDVSEVSPLSQGCCQLQSAAVSAPYYFLFLVSVLLSLELHSAVNISQSP